MLKVLSFLFINSLYLKQIFFQENDQLFNENINAISMDVYTFGYLMTTQKSNTPIKKTNFYNRIEKRNEINKQLNESVREIIHFTDSKNFMNNWIDLHDLIIDKVDHYLDERNIWSDALEDELLSFMSSFSNE